MDNLIPCDDCGNLVSLRAVTCPNCGSLVQTQAGVKAKLAEIKRAQDLLARERSKKIWLWLYVALCVILALMVFEDHWFVAITLFVAAFFGSEPVKNQFAKHKPNIKRWVWTTLSAFLFVIGAANVLMILNPPPTATTQQQITTAPQTVAQTALPSTTEAPKTEDKPKHTAEKKKKSTDTSLESTSSTMDFDTCLSAQNQWANEMQSIGIKVVPITQSSVLSVMRFCTSDGTVILTCDKADNKQIITKSPHSNGCD